MLEDPNIKWARVVSDGFGKRGRRRLDALVAGARAPHPRSAMALGTWRRKRPPLAGALEGPCTAPHAKRIAGALAWVAVLGRQSAEMAQQLQEVRGPMAPHLEQLASMPGVDEMTARALIAEIGLDLTRCGSASRRSAWAGLAPGHNARAGKRRKGRTRQGHRSLRRVLVPWAWAMRKPSTFLGRTFRRVEARVGSKKAAVAVAQKMLVSIYPRLLEGTLYEEER